VGTIELRDGDAGRGVRARADPRLIRRASDAKKMSIATIGKRFGSQ